ncbi:MAG: alpha/beta fold hydrolase [Sphingomonadales bacterium]
MPKFKTVLKWIGLTMGVLVSVVWLIDSDLVKLILPIRTAFPIVLGLAGILVLFRRVPLTIGAAGVFFSFAVFIFINGRMDYSEEELSFQSHGETLEGTLYIPDGSGPFQSVVFVHGSLCAPRRIYHAVADHMAANGIAVFSFDKRGTGASGGECVTENNTGLENLGLLSDDITAALELISKNPNVDPDRLGLWGISQAGWIAPLAAEKYPNLGFMVLVSGPSVSTGEENYYSSLTGDGHGAAEGDLTQLEIEALVEARDPSGFDPYQTLLNTNVPTLWIYGGQDSSIPVKKSIKRLEKLQEMGKNYDISLYPTSSHILVEMTFPYNFSEGFQDEVADWIKAQARKSS